MVTEEHITAFGWASPQEMDDIMSLALRINDFLSGLFLGVGIRLVDFKCEFGRLWENEQMRIVLADEISPDCCRLWDVETQNKLDKDRFRRDMGGWSRPIRRWPAGSGSMSTTRCGRSPAPYWCARNRTEAIDGRMKARITITLKTGVLDPQGKAIAGALHALGFGSVGNVRQGKYIEVEVAESDPARARAEVERMCEKLLANTIIENYAYELEAA